MKDLLLKNVFVLFVDAFCRFHNFGFWNQANDTEKKRNTFLEYVSTNLLAFVYLKFLIRITNERLHTHDCFLQQRK